MLKDDLGVGYNEKLSNMKTWKTFKKFKNYNKKPNKENYVFKDGIGI